MDQRRLPALAGKQRLEQLEIADGDRIQNHRVAAVVKGGAIKMIERGLLRLAQVVKNCTSGRDCQRLAAQAAAIEREQAEMVAQGAVGVVEAEDPIVERGAESVNVFG